MPAYSIESAPLKLLGDVEVDGNWIPGQVWEDQDGVRRVKAENIIGNVQATQFQTWD